MPEIAVLVRRLADAEAALRDGVGATVAAVMPAEGYASLLHDAQLGLLKAQEDLRASEVNSRALDVQLLTADRMASVGMLAAGVAHEINNPLASVVTNLVFVGESLSALASTMALPSELVEDVTHAREAAERVRTIVRDLKVFSRVEEDEPRNVAVERVMDSALRMAWNEIRHRARLVKRYEAIPTIRASESRLGQVFLNLLINAAQAIAEGNWEHHTITVTTSLSEAGRVEVRVADTGVGIPPELRDRVFQPFFTTKAAGVGTGLGLAICARIVSSLDGHISFVSEVGRGTEFIMSFPPAVDEMQSPAPAAAAVLPAAKRGRVLVVDDDEMFAQSVERILCREHAVRTAIGGAQALDVLRAGERFDVIVCDLLMPQVTGMAVHSALCQLAPDQAQRMVFLTGGAFTPAARAFLDAISNPWLEKPFAPPTLRALVNRLVLGAGEIGA